MWELAKSEHYAVLFENDPSRIAVYLDQFFSGERNAELVEDTGDNKVRQRDNCINSTSFCVKKFMLSERSGGTAGF